MKKISIKREQSQAGLSFAEREKFRPQVKNKLLLLLVLLAAVVSGAWAQEPATYKITLAEGTEDAGNWSVPAEAAEGSPVTATYSGDRKVKSVKAVKKAPAYTLLDNTMTAWTAGTYAVPAGGLTYSDAITVSGDVTLTLTDGETLTLNKGISLASGATLTVEGNGTMNVNGTNNSTASTVAGSTGTLILTSGTLTATGGNGGSVGFVMGVMEATAAMPSVTPTPASGWNTRST